jgi:hypothetical protein
MKTGTIIIVDVTFLQEKVTQPVEPHSSGLFQPIQRPLQADAEHVAVLIWSRDLESFRGTLIWISESSDTYKYAVTTSINCIFKFKLDAIEIRYRNVMPLITGEYVSS